MNDYLEKAKDILYNISDYLVMGAIVLTIGIIIFWRLDIILPENPSNTAAEKDSTITEASKELDESDASDSTSSSKEQGDANPSDDNPIEEIETVSISIPKGAHTSNIANILLENNLIESIDEFEEKVNDLKLEKALRSGDYEFESGEALDNIIKIIANKI